MLALYTGNLTAYIAIPKQTPPISTLTELSQQSVYSYGVMDGSALHLLFQGSAYGVYKHMMTNSIGEKENRVSSHNAGVDRVKSENYIYIGETSGVIKRVYSDCTLAIGKEKFFPSSFGFVIPENSSLQTYFDERIMQMTENGLIRKWFKKYYPKDICSLVRNSRDVPTSAKLHHFQGLFYMLSMGILASILALFIEYLVLFTGRFGYFAKTSKRCVQRKFLP